MERSEQNIADLNSALQEIRDITSQTHEGRHRAYTALSLIDGIVARALAEANIGR